MLSILVILGLKYSSFEIKKKFAIQKYTNTKNFDKNLEINLHPKFRKSKNKFGVFENDMEFKRSNAQ